MILDEIEEYLEQRADVRDGSDRKQLPNDAMDLLMRLREARRETPRHGKSLAPEARFANAAPQESAIAPTAIEANRDCASPAVAAPLTPFGEALYLLKCCRGTGDLVCDAYACFCDREEIYGLKVTERILLCDVVDAFLAKWASDKSPPQ